MTVNYGRLILVPTPLDFGLTGAGPLADLREVLPRATIETAARLRHWAVENAKTSRAFLKRVDAIAPLASALQAMDIKELPRPQKGSKPGAAISSDWQTLLAPALAGDDLGLMSEAGMPAIADPGATLVSAAHAAGIEVVSLPGPNSLMLALAASGLNGQSFSFVGYLPVDNAARAARIRELEATSRRLGQTQIIIETPYRNETLLSALLAHASPTVRIAVSCGLTMPDGWTRSCTVSQWKKAAPLTIQANVPAVFLLLAD